jgi:hypothetical protein
MAMTISARSVDGQRESPRINDLTIAALSLLEAALKRLLDLQKELLRLHVVTEAELHARAAGEAKRDQRQNKSSHLLLLPAEDLKHTNQGHEGGGDGAELLGVHRHANGGEQGEDAGIGGLFFESCDEVGHALGRVSKPCRVRYSGTANG